EEENVERRKRSTRRTSNYFRAGADASGYEVIGILRKDRVVSASRPKRLRETHIELVRFSFGSVRGGVVPKRIPRLDAAEKRGEGWVQRRRILYVEDSAAALLGHLANVHQPRNHRRGKQCGCRVVSGNLKVVHRSIRRNRLRDDVRCPLAAGEGSHVVADQ